MILRPGSASRPSRGTSTLPAALMILNISSGRSPSALDLLAAIE